MHTERGVAFLKKILSARRRIGLAVLSALLFALGLFALDRLLERGDPVPDAVPDTIVRADTVVQIDTIVRADTVLQTDTVSRTDTVATVDTVTTVDTVQSSRTVLRVDTLRIVDTVTVYRTAQVAATCEAEDGHHWLWDVTGLASSFTTGWLANGGRNDVVVEFVR